MNIKKIIVAVVLVLILVLILLSNKFRKTPVNVSFMSIIDREFIYVDEGGNPTDITLTFSSDRAFGYSGVNRYSSAYSMNDEILKIEPIITTMMAGPENKMKAETKYLKSLRDVYEVRLNRNNLTLTNTAGEELVFIEKK